MFEKYIFAIDYGQKRIGMSRSDPLRITAQPLETLSLKSTSEADKRVLSVLGQYDVELVVIGMPMSLSGGTGGKMADEVRRFAQSLERHGYKIAFEDERFTSSQAVDVLRLGGKKEKQMKGKIDSIAAQLILQGYLDSHPEFRG